MTAIAIPRRRILVPRPIAAFERLRDLRPLRPGMFGLPWGWPTPRRGGFSPLDIAGLEYWFKADAITGLSDADPVATWPDSSGNGRDATQGVAGLRPTYRTSVQNGLPVVRGDGVDDILSTAAVDINWGTVFMVFGDWTFTGGAEAWGNVNGTSNLRVLTIFANPTNLHADVADLHEAGVQNHIHRVDGVVTDNLGVVDFHVVTLKSQSAVSYGAAIFSLLDSVLNVNMRGDLGEALVYNTILGAVNEALVEGFLQAKWATPALP